MTDNAQNTPFDLDTLTDDEVMKLDPAQAQALMNQESVPNVETNDADTASDNAPLLDGNTAEPDLEGTAEGSAPDPYKTQAQTQPAEEATGSTEPAKPVAPKADKNQEADKPPVEADKPASGIDAAGAMDFYTKVSAPFKADGKDIQVRSPEDVIRLMQMGVNYSRRMQEMKPMRAIDNMLKAHGLNDPDKLSFLIDVAKGKPEAIEKLLKDRKIDPIDLDVTKETGYKTPNYQIDPKDQAFQEAIESTLAADGGKDLIKDINAQWDDMSKESLREQPAIFDNLLDQKRSGVYGKIKTELEYQRTMGFLTNVPFLQAYHQVGDAMQKAGVFGTSNEIKVQSARGETPIDTGTRKAAPKPKTEQPNPNLSSTTQPRVASSNGGNQSTPDYATLSDADFLKLVPPR